MVLSALRTTVEQRYTGYMAATVTLTPTTPEIVSDTSLHLAEAIDDFRLTLESENKSAATIAAYEHAARRFLTHARAAGMPLNIGSIRREHVEAWLVAMREDGTSESSVETYYRRLQQFFEWAVRTEEIAGSPMARMQKPKVPEQPIPLLSDEEIKRLLKVTSGSSYDDRRDHAIIRLFLDTGMRLEELARLTTADVLTEGGNVLLAIIRKGGSRETVSVESPAAKLALKRYLRARGSGKHHSRKGLWIGTKGPMTKSGIAQLLKRRGAEAEIDNLHAHLFRHVTNHKMAMAGLSEGDRMALMGWRSAEMARRYGDGRLTMPTERTCSTSPRRP